MIRNEKTRMYFYVRLTRISVSDQLLPVLRAIFELQEDSNGGVLIDSGTHVTRLAIAVFELFHDSFVQKAENLSTPTTEVSSFLYTCYYLSGMDTVSVPTVSFHFAGDKIVNLLPLNYMLQYKTGLYCVGVRFRNIIKYI
ncbi:protein ASPARTIC PROTEASE IN GUARD CELL 1-like [Cornus florida]|uniref:protein ASPARTIC PROTEASE IN GUARD CELL 1-like n=1 Tax=Cornus florida TaxID=4283 RepID=UPI00289C5425|nr:protein ASPARTIC PROTEASE IN GUARD CELL 1-like [Cornus florida]